MNNLYTSLAEIYEMMYQTFIDYDEEFGFYSKKIKLHDARSILELGCGTGDLAKRFIAHDFDYTGLDLSEQMLEAARKKNPKGKFYPGDMRHFTLDYRNDAVLLAGRTLSYLIDGKDVEATFQSIHKNLAPKGIVCFDAIDAEKFLPGIREGKSISHYAKFAKREFKRESFWTVQDGNTGTFAWRSIFFENDAQSWKEVGRDSSVIRTFRRHQLADTLEKLGFSITEVQDRSSYAFDTFVITAQKTK